VEPSATLDTPTFAIDDALTLVRDLGVSFAVAQVLVRRDLGNTEQARRFLAADVEHPASEFDGIADAVRTILAAAEAGSTITVHGDYDVDGVASTAILVRALRSVGAEVDWFLPSRTEDGYGLRELTVRRLAERGTKLLLATDCGITAVEEVALAKKLGMEVVVVDHHTPRSDGVLPDAPIVHPAVCGYPCADLCAAGVAWKLSGALLEAAGHDEAINRADLDLVALATVADCVPLIDENRRLVKHGLRTLSRTEKPGLRALMRVAQVEQQKITARDIGFRLAPRLNAAGRIARADAALELLLTHDDVRATEIAEELDDANARRRFEETRILHEAEAQVAALGEQPAYVLSGEGWHPGVIGIVASRIAERHHRPTVIVGITDGAGTGSGRSIPGVDLLAGFTAASATLERFGGHRAAAGCTVRADQLGAFRAAFVEHFAQTLTADDLVARARVDAVVGGDELGYELASELERLGPFGIGNPTVALSVPGARLVDSRPIGEGKHLRFTVAAGGVRAQAVAFGMSTLPEAAAAGRVDATFSLELGEFRGAVEPRLVLRHIAETADVAPTLVGEPAPETAEWEQLVLALAHAAPVASTDPAFADSRASSSRFKRNDVAGPRLRDRRGAGIGGTIGALAASGEPVLVVCADAVLRREQSRGRMTGFSICSWDALAADSALTDDVEHLVALDPPLSAAHQELLESLTTSIMVHLAWGEAELRCSRDALDRDFLLRPGLVAAYRALRDGQPLRDAFGQVPAQRAGRVLAVLLELGLVELSGPGEELLQVLPGPARTELESSTVFQLAASEHEERVAWLNELSAAPPPAIAA
jgi:single-stranded-DNA-specific exonuclease